MPISLAAGVGAPRYRRSMPAAVRVLDTFDVPSSLSFEVGEVRDQLPPGWRVVVLEVDGDLVVTGEPEPATTTHPGACAPV